jgi:hypothetical protein
MYCPQHNGKVAQGVLGWLVVGLPDFSWYMTPKLEKMYKVNIKCIKRSKNILNVRKIFQVATKYINIFQHKALQNGPKLGFLV